jgi:hypothetical protein
MEEEFALSAAKYIFVLYVIVSGNFLANTFGCRVQDALNNSMILKHLLGYMTMLFFVVLVDEKTGTGPHYQIFMTMLLYLAFVLTTRVEYKYWKIFIGLLCVNYILQVYRQHESTTEKDKESLQKAQRVLLGAATVVVLGGTLVYFARKRLEYGSKFDITTFFLGKTTCAFTKTEATFKDDLAALFGNKK